MNGPSPFAMVIGHGLRGAANWGWLVSNHLIRRAAWDAVQDSIARHGDVTLIAGDGVARTQVDAGAARVTLASGGAAPRRLLVRPASRFHAARGGHRRPPAHLAARCWSAG